MDYVWADLEWTKSIISILKRSIVFGSDEECPVERVRLTQIFGTFTVAIDILFTSKRGSITVAGVIVNTSQSAAQVVDEVLCAAESVLTQMDINGMQESMNGLISAQDIIDDEPWMLEHKKLYGKK